MNRELATVCVQDDSGQAHSQNNTQSLYYEVDDTGRGKLWFGVGLHKFTHANNTSKQQTL